VKPIKVVTIFGTRPEAIKMAPVVLQLRKFPQYFKTIVAVTAQHREMLDQVLDLFQIKPDYDLDIMQSGQTLFDITTRSLTGLARVISEVRPDLVLVHGDTTTTFVGALAAFYHQVAVGHVEAGLRTHQKYSPYPEEMNRRLSGVLTDLHFAPTETSYRNLVQEAVPNNNIVITGNTVIDALLRTVRADYKFKEPLLESIDFANKRIVLVTTHRRENLGEPMRQCYAALRRITEEYEDVEIIFPVHLNPKVREVVACELGQCRQVRLTEPLDYEPFANLMARAHLILTDSGGIQEEAPSLGKPVLVLRDTTERPEAIDAGTVKLIGTHEEDVYRETKLLLDNQAEYSRMANATNPYGDGMASERIMQAILYYFGRIQQPPKAFFFEQGK
jgi:UDP-N-acetylglucosamine 2-epimerase (non-hydrolysing)